MERKLGRAESRVRRSEESRKDGRGIGKMEGGRLVENVTRYAPVEGGR